MKPLLILLALLPLPALAIEMGQPPSVLAEILGKNTAEVAACGATKAQILQYSQEATKKLDQVSAKTKSEAANLALYKDSFRDASASYSDGSATPDCATLVSRVRIR